ncbi:hypothetical protein [Halioxenophilus sp. WMMB6]|uniref:hypothetical protein n=1 Tax=Halioxenophilus sp. WMMB6 TaxID=3073815 RepID=UPI00295F318D|nr:hypothetical protein [Halioxenophilus sp. WMMB6]
MHDKAKPIAMAKQTTAWSSFVVLQSACVGGVRWRILLRLMCMFLVPAVATMLLSSCARQIAIESSRFLTTDEIYEDDVVVRPYPGLPYKKALGPFLSVRFSSNSDLEGMAKKYTHHLYFQVVPCSQNKLGYELLSGAVYKSSRIYVAYIPINTELMLQNVNGYGALDAQSYLRKAREEGICFHVGGGQMWFGSLRSNNLNLPLYLTEENELKSEFH